MWEDRYRAEDGYLFGQEPAQVLVENPWITSGCSSCLCVADGEGRNSAHLARVGLSVTAFDPAPTAVGRARELARGLDVTHHVAGWDDWDWSHQYDLVVGIFIQFADPAFRARQFTDMARATRSGGRVVLHGYTPEQVDLGTGGPPNRSHMYTVEMLGDAFGGWQIERLAAYERDVQEGRGHSGRSALIDLVVRKPG